MRDKQCDEIRRELEEGTLNEEFSITAAEHMRGCADCREFQRQQLKLRQIIGSLGTVNAPADFDFRLRARLAADSERSGIRYWTFAVKGLATVAVLVVFGVAGAIVWQSTRPGTSVADGQQQGAPQQPQQGQAEPRQPEQARHADQASADRRNEPQIVANNTPRRNNARPIVNKAPRISTVEGSSTGAKVMKLGQPMLDPAPVFQIDASLQSVKVSLDDGRGNERTISFPTVTFGSQRVLANGNQFAPKGVVW